MRGMECGLAQCKVARVVRLPLSGVTKCAAAQQHAAFRHAHKAAADATACQISSCSTTPAVRQNGVPNLSRSTPANALRRTHHTALHHVHGAAADDGKEAGAQAGGDVAVDVVLERAAPVPREGREERQHMSLSVTREQRRGNMSQDMPLLCCTREQRRAGVHP